ncbi:hypothetical protein ONZ45_g19503 [Pleurotus djamor]|nr:hypothetical protein ONZ45_g19503 [Pleurotus djamor]
MNTPSRISIKEDILRRLRSLWISCLPVDGLNLFKLMRDLERVEFLSIELAGMMSLDIFSPSVPLDIPSKAVKYICLRSTHLCDDSLIAERSFDLHPNLVIVDIRRTTPVPSETEIIVNRYVKQGGEYNCWGLLKGFSVSQPKVFESWWEVREIRDDVEEASANGLSYLNRRWIRR